MKQVKFFVILSLSIICLYNHSYAQQNMESNQALNKSEQSIVAISAFTAKGDLAQLKTALHEGLEAGLSISVIKEVLVQLYAYTGFPRSLNALQAFMAVLKERKANGVADQPGKDASPLPADRNRLTYGTDLQTKLIGQPVTGDVYEFAPAIDTFLKEHLFGDIFGRDNVDWKIRELATISALASLGGTENQLRSHIGVGMHNGLSEAKLTHFVAIIQTKVGAKEGASADSVLQVVLQRQPANASAKSNSKTVGTERKDLLFAKGEKITNNNFRGNVWLQNLADSDTLQRNRVGSVMFEPGARTSWHYHPGGQRLLVVRGTGFYQEKGRPKKILRQGDVVKCPPNVPHWHGASSDDEFVQIAITGSKKGATVWQQPVTDEEYNADK